MSMFNGFITKVFSSFLLVNKNTPNANSTQELASPVSQKTNHLKNIAKKAILPVLIASNVIAGGGIKAQEKDQETQIAKIGAQVNGFQFDDEINPKVHTINDPYSIANIGVIVGQGNIILWNIGVIGGGSLRTEAPGNQGSHTIISPDGRTITSKKFLVDRPGKRQIKYTDSEGQKIIECRFNYKVNPEDQTPGSATYGQNTKYIFVNEGQKATVNAGGKINYKKNSAGGYAFEKLDGTMVSGGSLDSIAQLDPDIYRIWTNDGTSIYPNAISDDTLSVLIKPTLNQTAKTISFPRTISGVTYKVYEGTGIDAKGDTIRSKVNETNGDGNPYEFSNLKDKTKYKVRVERIGSGKEGTYPNTLTTSFTTVIDELGNSKLFAQKNRDIYFQEDQLYTVYRIDGTPVITGNSNHIHIDQPGIYILQLGKNNKAEKIMVK